MTSTLIWPSGERERIDAGTCLSDLERSCPGVFLEEFPLTASPPRAHRQLNFLTEENKTYFVRGGEDESRFLRQQIDQLERTVSSLQRALDHPPSKNGRKRKPLSMRLSRKEDSPQPPEKTLLRQHIVDEIVHSEVEYLKELYLLSSIFHQSFVTLSKEPNSPITEKMVSTLFEALPPIIKMNNKFLRVLQEDPEGEHVGSSFLAFRAECKKYCTFIENHDERNQLLQSLRNKPKTAELLETMERTKAADLGDRRIGDLLIHPVKRVPQYIILLQRLYKHTPSCHPDSRSLEEAINSYQEMATLFDENSQHVADARTVLSMMSSFRIPKKFDDMPIINAHRVFLFEVESCQVVLPGKTSNRLRACVFNDCILFLCRSRRSIIFSAASEEELDRVGWVVRYWLPLDKIHQVRFIDETHTIHVTIQASCHSWEPLYIHAEGRELQSWRNYFDSRVIGPRTRTPTRRSTPKLPRSRSVLAEKHSSTVLSQSPIQVPHSSDSINHRQSAKPFSLAPALKAMAQRSRSACDSAKFRLSPRKRQ